MGDLTPRDPTTEPLLSPCTGVCTLDENDWCIGCARSLDEIAAWGTMSADDRRMVMASLASRYDRSAA